MRTTPRALFVFVASIAWISHVAVGGPAKPPVGLREAKIDDKPTFLSIPVSATSSLLVSLPERHWILCEPHTGRVLSMAGVGVIVQSIQDLEKTAMTSRVNIGAIPLAEPVAGETLDARIGRTEVAFVADLRAKYEPLFLTMLTEPAAIKIAPTTVKLDGKKVPAARTSRYNVKFPLTTSATDGLLASECVFLHIAGTETIVYIAIDSRVPARTLDEIIANLSVVRTNVVNKNAGVRQLIDLSHRDTDTYPRHFVSYESPIGFAPDYAGRARDRVNFAEDRVNDKGVLTARYQVDCEIQSPAEGSLARAKSSGVSWAWTRASR